MSESEQSRWLHSLGHVRWDLIVCVVGMLSGGALSWQLTAGEPFRSHKNERWFDADLPRVYAGMSQRWTPEHHRCSVHPLFALTMVPTHYALTRGLGLGEESAIRLLLACGATVWAGLLYATLRLMRRTMLDSVIFLGIGLASAASLFFLSVPETYVFGSTTILACLCAATAYERGFLSARWVWAAAALSLTMTTTNFMAGGFALIVLFGWRVGFQKAVNAFFLIAVLSAVQSLLFPDAGSFLTLGVERHFIGREESGGVLAKGRALVFHSVVAPEIQLLTNRTGYRCMSFQQSPLGSSGAVGLAATVAWALILIAGAWGTLRDRALPLSRNVLLLTTAGQILLHLVYGFELFLYSLHIAPLLVLIASGSITLKGAWLFRLLGLAFLVLLVWNNWAAIETARGLWPAL